MLPANNDTRLMYDLAAHWTDSVLEVLKAAGVPSISVAMELATWQTLKDVLQAELRWQRAFRFSTLVPYATLSDNVVRKAALMMARRCAPRLVSDEFKGRVQDLVRDRHTTAAELALYAEIVRQPALQGAFKPPTRTDYFPRLRTSAGL